MLILAALCAIGSLILPTAAVGTSSHGRPPFTGHRALARTEEATVRPAAPGALAVGPGGQLYIAEDTLHRIIELLPDGRFRLVAGTGKAGFGGDSGPAVSAWLREPGGMVVGSNGTLYFADEGNGRVRAISAAGIISTVAGNGKFGWAKTGTPAQAAPLGGVAAVTVGPSGELYIADATNNEVLRLDSVGVLHKVVGTRAHPAGLFGIGQPATQASPDVPDGLAFDRAGNLYIAGFANKTLLMVTPRGRLVLPMGEYNFYPRGDGGLVTGPNGSVIAMDGDAIVRLTPTGKKVIRDLSGLHVDGIRGFRPNGIAVAPDGTIFTDTDLGNGVARQSALIKFRPGGRIHVLWRSQ